MKRYVIAVFDTASQLYGQPMFVAARGQAVRSFTDEVNRSAQDNPLFMHPEDWELYLLATYDDETGIFTSEGSEIIARGKDVRHVSQ